MTKTAIAPELLDQLLANYSKPEDLTGENGLFKQLKKAFRRDKSQGNYLFRSGDSKPRLYVKGVFYPKVLCASEDGKSLWLSTYTGLHRIPLGDAK